MKPYQLMVSFQCCNGGREAFLRSIVEKGILTQIRNEDGCLGYDFYLSIQDENELLLIETWSDSTHQHAHLAQKHMKPFLEEKEKYVLQWKVKQMEVTDVI